ncbi:hypothetical protein MMC21_006641 [Puttea exsequens]|nr:hypothetical protein [Puttea exsequens]
MSKEDELASSQEQLLHHDPESSTLDSRSSTSDSDVDELDLVDGVELSRPRGGWSSIKGERSVKGKEKEGTLPLQLKRKKPAWCNKWSLFALIGVLAITLAVIAGLHAIETPHKKGNHPYSPPYYPSPKGGTLASWEQSYKKAAKLVSKMSLPAKVNITTGVGWGQDLCVGNTASAYEFGFPPLCLQDGPLGIRFADHATAWPAGITVGATWNKKLMYKRGRGLGLEHRLKGVNVWLGPSMGPIGRIPGGGRNWEGFGPDPVLQAVAAGETIRGVQEEGVIATAKHLIANEQEHFRQEGEWPGGTEALSSNIDDRTLHELYLWPFAESVRVGVASVMCSYNQVNASYACENSWLLNGILKEELGFQGFVQSDWLAQRSGVGSALAGLDMNMPGDGLVWHDGDSLWGGKLTEAVLNSSVPLERIDDMVTRTVAAWYQLGQDDKKKWPALPKGGPNFSSFTDDKIGKLHPDSDDETTAVVNQFKDVQGKGDKFHGKLAREIAAEGTVLVKNVDNTLPLSSNGRPASSRRRDGIYRVGIFGEDAAQNPDGPNACVDRSCNIGTLASGWGSGSVEFPYLVTPVEALQSSFNKDAVAITEVLTNDIPSSWPDTQGHQDLCLVFINSDAGEGFETWEGINDRPDLYAQKNGEDLVKKVQNKCEQTVVVVHAVGPVIVDRWIDLPNIKAVLLAHLPGQESGNALADVLFGRVDASGRLPYTIAKKFKDYGPAREILRKATSQTPQQDFDEGLYIDYRHFDKKSITPRYEFGFGLSYTTFTLTSLTLTPLAPRHPLPPPPPSLSLSPPSYPTTLPDPSSALGPTSFWKLKGRIYPYLDSTNITTGPYPYPSGYSLTPPPPGPAGGGEGGNPALYDPLARVAVTVTNTGARRGKQVVQVYVSFPPDVRDAWSATEAPAKVDFPVRVLRGFEKVQVEVGESRVVEVVLCRKDLSFWSAGRQNWVIPEGEIGVSVGLSSRDLPLSVLF